MGFFIFIRKKKTNKKGIQQGFDTLSSMSRDIRLDHWDTVQFYERPLKKRIIWAFRFFDAMRFESVARQTQRPESSHSVLSIYTLLSGHDDSFLIVTWSRNGEKQLWFVSVGLFSDAVVKFLVPWNSFLGRFMAQEAPFTPHCLVTASGPSAVVRSLKIRWIWLCVGLSFF